MATHGNYKELVAGWGVTYGLTGSTATRIFHDDTTESAWLPQVGDPFGTTKPDSELYCESVQKTKLGGHPDKHLYTCSYSTRQTGGNTQTSTNPSKYWERSFQLGMEVISIDGKLSAYKWGSAGGVPVNQKIAKRVGSGSFTIERRTTKSTVPTEVLRNSYIGRINSVTFEKFAPSTVLFAGISGSQYVNDSGQIRWKLSLSFEFKECTWLQLLRESTGAFTTVYPAMYQSVDLNNLMRSTFF